LYCCKISTCFVAYTHGPHHVAQKSNNISFCSENEVILCSEIIYETIIDCAYSVLREISTITKINFLTLIHFIFMNTTNIPNLNFLRKTKTIIVLTFLLTHLSCAELQQVVNQLPQGTGISNAEIASGLRQALDFGIEKQVTKLAEADGFFKNELVKILLPEELQKVDKTLRDIGLSNLADEGLKVLNRAAEDAVKEATPIFVDAVKGITFADAKNILLGNDDAATQYLTTKTQTALYDKFHPVINNSFAKVGADQIWTNLINKYNSIPLTNNVNPDLTDYVTGEVLKGVYTMIAVEEKEIRNKISSRTTEVLKKVFALKD